MATFKKISSNNRVHSMVIRPIINLDKFDGNLYVTPRRFGFLPSVIDSDSLLFLNAKKIADEKDEVCIAFYSAEDGQKYAISERDDESGIMKFVIFNAQECAAENSTVHAISQRSENDPIRWERYLRFEKGSLA